MFAGIQALTRKALEEAGSGGGAGGHRGGLWGPGQGVGGRSSPVTSERGGAYRERWELPDSGVETGPGSLCLRSQVVGTATLTPSGIPPGQGPWKPSW